jgi:DNA-binding response OmpR family regulator
VKFLNGKRILCVEDEPLVAMTLVLFLEEAGCRVIGPAHTLAEGLRLSEGEAIDAAILDVNLGNGASSASIADVLRDRAIPFLFATGYDSDALNVRRLSKPYTQEQLTRALCAILPEKF